LKESDYEDFSKLPHVGIVLLVALAFFRCRQRRLYLVKNPCGDSCGKRSITVHRWWSAG